MRFRFNLVARAAGLAAGLLAPTPALAADLGTDAGTIVSNQATISYSVGGNAQTPVTSDDPTAPGANDPTTFLVDRRVNLSVSEVGNATTLVQPGQVNRVTLFRLQNLSNATLDFDLTAAQISSGTANAAHGGDDTFDATAPLRVYRDANNNGQLNACEPGQTTGCDPLLETGTTGIDELVEDGSVDLLVVMDIPNNVTGVAGVTLKATARAGGTANTFGDVLTNDNANPDIAGTVQNVFADGTGPASGDTDRDGEASDDDDYTAQPLPTVTKTGRVVEDTINGTSNPKAIPGATVEYCIRIQNTGPLQISAVTISDPVPTNTTYKASTIYVGGTVTNGSCDANGTQANDAYTQGTDDNGLDASANPATVKALIPTLNSGATTTVRFQVTIN